MLSEKEVISKIFWDYYSHDIYPDLKLNGIELDAQLFYLIKLINDCKKYCKIDLFIKYGLTEFQKKVTAIENVPEGDSLYAEKVLLHLKYPWYPSLERLRIIESSLSESDCRRFIDISIESIYRITSIIIIRTLLYSTSFAKNKLNSKSDLIKLFGNENPQVWFRKEDLLLINKNIQKDDLDVYFSLFSKAITSISTEDKNVFYIYKNNDEYAVIFLEDFADYVFCQTEKSLIGELKLSSNERLEEYKLRRGKALEECVHQMVSSNFNETFANANYIDAENKKREIDILGVDNDLFVNFECKTSKINIFEYANDGLTNMKVAGAFGNSLSSINALHTYFDSTSKLELYKRKKGEASTIGINSRKLISVQITLYPIDLIGTYLHFFNERNIGKYNIYPINLCFTDFICIMVLMNMNKKLVNYYFEERFGTINKQKKFQLDIDEIDAFGFITDDSLSNGYKTIKQLETAAEIRMMISNSAYREEVNWQFAEMGLKTIIEEFVDNEIKLTVKKIFTEER